MIAALGSHVGREELAELADCLERQWLGSGPKTAAFETEFARRQGLPNLVVVNSGSNALYLAVTLLDLPPGSDIVVPSFTWVSCAHSILLAGHRPVFCDVDLDTQNVTAETIAAVDDAQHEGHHGRSLRRPACADDVDCRARAADHRGRGARGGLEARRTAVRRARRRRRLQLRRREEPGDGRRRRRHHARPRAGRTRTPPAILRDRQVGVRCRGDGQRTLVGTRHHGGVPEDARVGSERRRGAGAVAKARRAPVPRGGASGTSTRSSSPTSTGCAGRSMPATATGTRTSRT